MQFQTEQWQSQFTGYVLQHVLAVSEQNFNMTGTEVNIIGINTQFHNLK